MTARKRTIIILVLTWSILSIYTVLSSKLVEYRSEKKVMDIVVEWAMELPRQEKLQQAIVEREKELTGKTDDELAGRLAGRFLLQVESDGEAWYVFPGNKKRYYLGHPKKVYDLALELGSALENDQLVDYLYFDKKFPAELAGRFVSSGRDLTELYYIDPASLTARSILSPNQAMEFIREASLGISNQDLRKISVGEVE